MKSLLIVAFLFFFCTGNSPAETPKSPEEILKAYLKEAAEFKLGDMVNHMHPTALQSFKKHALEITAASAKRYSEAEVEGALKELGRLSGLKGVEPRDLWILVTQPMYSYAVDWQTGAAIEIVGKVEHGEFVHVLYTGRRDGSAKDGGEAHRAPKTVVFKKHGSEWRIWSFDTSALGRYIDWYVVSQRAERRPRRSE